jgi:hypothetical protein
MLGQAFDLLDIEDGVALHEGDLLLAFLDGVGVGLGAGNPVGIDNERTFLALSLGRFQFPRLFEGHPDRGGVACLHRR